MTGEKFNQIKNLYEKIDSKKQSIRQIDSLINSCGLSCKISGTPRGTFSKTPEYYFSNKEQIVKMLMIEKENIESELLVLEKTFSEQ